MIKKNTLLGCLLFITTVLQAQNYIKFKDKNGKIGFKDSIGKILITPKYQGTLSNFSQGLVGVMQNNRWGFIDTTGKTVVPFKYDEVGSFTDQGFARVYIEKGENWGLVNKTGKEIIEVKYGMMEELFNYNMIALCSNNGCGIMNDQGKLIIPFEYQRCRVIGENLVEVTLGGKKGIMNTKVRGIDEKTHKGIPYELILPIKYDEIWALTETLYKIVLDKKWGLINDKGIQILPCEYNYIQYLENGKVEVTDSNYKIFYIDETGKRLFE